MNIYIIEANAGPIKIGISRDPQRRLAQLQTATHLQLSLAHIEQTERASEIEQATHIALASKRLTGEWFNASVAEAIQTINDCLAALPPRQESIEQNNNTEQLIAATPKTDFKYRNSDIDTSELEHAAVAFFKAIQSTGKKCLGHDQFGFKLDINTMCPSDDKEGALLLGAKLQEALTVAQRAVQPVTIEGTTLQ